MTKPEPSRDQGKFVVRMPPGMRDKIALAAAAAGRSMNAEIVYRLETSLQRDHLAAIADRANATEVPPATEDSIKNLARELFKVMTAISANEDGTTATLGESIERAQKLSGKSETK